MIEKVFDIDIHLRDKCTLSEIKGGRDEKIKNRLKVELDKQFDIWFERKTKELNKELDNDL